MTTDPAAAAAEEIIRKAKLTAYGSADVGNALEGDFGTWDDWRALIEAELRRHYAEAIAGRQAAVDRLVDAAESLRAEVATIVNDPDQTDLPGLEDAYCRTIEALDAVRSLPPDQQDSALTAEREALLRRAVAAALIESVKSESAGLGISPQAKSVLADAARLGITGEAK